MENNSPYIPIACSFYDRIEEAIVLRKVVRLAYLQPDGTERCIETRLKDTQTQDKGEFLLLPEGEPIRMDRIVSLDGEPLLGSC